MRPMEALILDFASVESQQIQQVAHLLYLIVEVRPGKGMLWSRLELHWTAAWLHQAKVQSAIEDVTL